MNKEKPKQKRGLTDIEINNYTKLLFGILALISISLLFLSNKYKTDFWLVYLIKTFLILSFIIPISMKVNLDFAKIKYAVEINRDKSSPGVVVRNSNIPEELGRVQYLMSDKTGTLTKNKMTLKELIGTKESF
jgi:phospholipid-translocating ATPase